MRDVPAAFKDWVKERSEKIETARNLPYFIRDNQKRVDRILGKGEEVKKSPLEIAKERHEARTPEQAAAIRKAWYDRKANNTIAELKEGRNETMVLARIYFLATETKKAPTHCCRKLTKRAA